MIIEFTESEMEQIERLALIRHHSAGVAVPPKYHKGSALDIDRLGAMGEAALSKHFEWAVSTMMFSNRDDGKDFKTDLGSIQVKTRGDEKATLFIQTSKVFPADMGVLCRQVAPNAIEIVGWFFKETWNKFMEAREMGGGVRFVLPVERMNTDIDDILETD
jgi:hypothetical protein